MITPRAKTWFSGLALLAVTALPACIMSPLAPSVGSVSSNGMGRTTDPEIAAQRPLSDFLSAQGSTSLFFPPVPDFIGWSNNNPQTKFTGIDYAGLAAATLASNGVPAFGTKMSGTVSERRLSDGRAEVTVNLHTERALTWVCALPGDISTNPVLYGYRAGDFLADHSLVPALSDVHMKAVFTNDAPGAALPDLVNAFILGNATPAQTLKFLFFEASGTGALHAAYGVPEGTPGRIHVIQTGIFVTRGGGATADGFPAEKVELRAVGRGSAKP